MDNTNDSYLINKNNVDFHTQELELILGLTIIVWIVDLSKDLKTLEFIGWIITLTLYVPLSKMIITIREYVSHRDSLDQIAISSWDTMLKNKFENAILFGVVILLIFSLGGWIYIQYISKIWDVVYILKCAVLLATWVIIPYEFLARVFYKYE